MDPIAEHDDIRETVRRRYARAASDGAAGDCCGTAASGPTSGPASTCGSGQEVFGAGLYSPDVAEGATEAALAASLGCGVPTAVADLNPGEVVLDLGSGAGADVLISARRVGPTGRAIGLDMTEEMLELARSNAAAAGATNVEFVQGYLEAIPLPDESVDVVISNCVINLAADKQLVLAEAARVLRAGGRVAISDVVADPDMDEATRSDMEAWTGCIAGALTVEEYISALSASGFTDIAITEGHRVHAHAASAIVRAHKPEVTG
ncbi:MAG: arsenite methyltransferase [Acidimicrobiales bacterium]